MGILIAAKVSDILAFYKYLQDLGCPHKSSDTKTVLDWLLGLAVHLEYSDDRPVPSRKVVPPDFPDVVEVRRRLEANHTMESSKWRQSKVAKDNGMSSFPGRPRRGLSVGLVARQLRVVRSSHPTASGLSSARRETTGSSGVPAKSLEPTWCPKRCQMTTKSSLWESKILAMIEPVD
ncbi:hypothetical protein HPB51_019609 [Rhipicephalus microplus]|uniref:Uncharacterized protein n=1 Tax=Rhipicephalus microplus TaxID=6941 RepID=A0A9J6DIC0_RHIMP|nr:hypothetical protein HPB51_019609 [Rhipicephalus microplus]